MINGLAEGRTETPQTRKTLAPAGPASGRIAMRKGHQSRSKKPRCRTFRITFGRVAGRRASFLGGCYISGNSRTLHGPHRRRRDDDDPRYEARLVLVLVRARAFRRARAPCVRHGHGGAVVLAVGRAAFVSCATLKGAGAGTSFNGSDAAA